MDKGSCDRNVRQSHLDRLDGNDGAKSSDAGRRLSARAAMAHDSDVIDSWDLESDLAPRGLYRNAAKVTAIRQHEPHDSKNYRNQSNNLSNEFLHLQPRRNFVRSSSDVARNDPANFYGVSSEQDYGFPHRCSVKNSCGDSDALNFSSLSINESPKRDDGPVHDRDPSTYRCQPAVVSPLTPSSLSSRGKSSVRVISCSIGKNELDQEYEALDEPQVQRYALNGTKVIEYSGSSISLSDRGGSTSRGAKRRVYEEWLEKKRAEEMRRKEELRKADLEKQTEEERIVKEREEREKRERDNFLQWSERKRKEEASKRQTLERQLEFERRLKEVEDKAIVAKNLFLRQWTRKKEEEQKVLQRQEELKKKKNNEERRKRLEESAKAYTKWKQTSKNRPKPATQGLLPHQMGRPSYVNPNPWVMDDGEVEDTPKKQSSDDLKKVTGSNARTSIAVSKQ